MLSHKLDDPERLMLLYELGLLDTPPEEQFDRLTRLACKFVSATVSLITIVDAQRQYFKSAVGLPEPWASRGETPLTHSFCQHVVLQGEPLIVEDARQHTLLHLSPAIDELHFVAYLGIPLITPAGICVGSLCVTDPAPREWSDDEIDTVQDLAASAMLEIELRVELITRIRTEHRLYQRTRQLRQITQFCRKTLEYLQNSAERGTLPPAHLDSIKAARFELSGLENSHWESML